VRGRLSDEPHHELSLSPNQALGIAIRSIFSAHARHSFLDTPPPLPHASEVEVLEHIGDSQVLFKMASALVSRMRQKSPSLSTEADFYPIRIIAFISGSSLRPLPELPLRVSECAPLVCLDSKAHLWSALFYGDSTEQANQEKGQHHEAVHPVVI
jgi:hypothetical protein